MLILTTEPSGTLYKAQAYVQVDILVHTTHPHYKHTFDAMQYAIYNTSFLTLKVLVTTIDAQWEGMGDVGSARYEPALLPPCPTIRVLSYSN